MVDIVAAVLEGRAARSENKFDDLLVPLFRKSAKLIVAAIGFVFIADNLNVDITSLIAGLGIGGLALALAAQDTVKNLFGSLTVILDQPFSVGDWVKIGDIEGTVSELGFRSTRIKTFYDSTITLPNASLISASVDNLGARTYRRWSTTLGLAYETPAEKVEAFCEGIRELVRKHPQTRKDSYQVYLNSFSAASIDVLLYIFFQTPDWASELAARHRMALDIMRLAQSLGVEFAYPTQTLYLKRPGDPEALSPFGDYGQRLGDVQADARARADEISQGVHGLPVKTVGGAKGSAGEG
ncbi:MAG: mechanosensitive ion channel family protein, partial [Acidobacteriota bacterium]